MVPRSAPKIKVMGSFQKKSFSCYIIKNKEKISLFEERKLI
jgi:hypothetical protein